MRISTASSSGTRAERSALWYGVAAAVGAQVALCRVLARAAATAAELDPTAGDASAQHASRPAPAVVAPAVRSAAA